MQQQSPHCYALWGIFFIMLPRGRLQPWNKLEQERMDTKLHMIVGGKIDRNTVLGNMDIRSIVFGL